MSQIIVFILLGAFIFFVGYILGERKGYKNFQKLRKQYKKIINLLAENTYECPMVNKRVVARASIGAGKSYCVQSYQAGVRDVISDLFHTSSHKLQDKIKKYLEESKELNK